MAITHELAEGLSANRIRVVHSAAPGYGEVDPWFETCVSSIAVVALLSKAFVSSNRCEDQCTFAKDYGKKVVPVLVDLDGYSHATEAIE